MSNLVQIQKDAVIFDDKKLELIRKTVANQLTPNEFELFISIAKARGLDPILNQIHAVVRGKDEKAKVNFQVGIDGFRLIAARTGEFAGRDETIFDYKPGSHQPDKAKVTVYRFVSGVRCAWTASAKWAEYFPSQENQQFLWKKLPETMLEKCAEAKALRMAFPNDLSGLYVNEEMDQAEGRQQTRDASPQIQSSEPEFSELSPEEQSHNFGEYVFPIGRKYKGMRLKDINENELDKYLIWLKGEIEKQPEKTTQETKDAVEHAETYLKSREFSR